MSRGDRTIREVLATGAAAGLGGALLLSLLARLPFVRATLGRARREEPRALPADPHDRAQVRAWQERSWSPAMREPQSLPADERAAYLMQVGPATALRQPEAPGPEGLAEQFAYKAASGMFDRDIAGSVRAYGRLVHFGYGSLWGMIYGLALGERARATPASGVVAGLAIYAVGPALLLPAMRILGKPHEEPGGRTALLLAAHIAYGAFLAGAFSATSRTNDDHSLAR